MLYFKGFVSEGNVKLIKMLNTKEKENKSTQSQLYTATAALLMTSVIVNHYSLK